MKTIVASSRDWPYFLFVFGVLATNIAITLYEGFSTLLALAFIPAAWLLYDVLINRIVVYVTEDHIIQKRGFSETMIPWQSVTAIKINDQHQVVISHTSENSEQTETSDLTLSRVADPAEELQADLIECWKTEAKPE